LRKESCWVQVAPYGIFTHPKGLQRLTRPSANEIIQQFNSLYGRIMRRLKGLPIYIGHPDDSEFAGLPGHTDKGVYGTVQELAVRKEGLYARIEWTDEGRKLINRGKYRYLSPRWVLRSIYADVYEPNRLLSIGLTNSPNIPGDPIKARPRPVLNNIPTRSRTEGLVFCNSRYNNPQPEFLKKVHEHMDKTGETYLTSWKHIKGRYPNLCASF